MTEQLQTGDVVVLDFEYTPRDGELPDVICGVALALSTSEVRTWRRDRPCPQRLFGPGDTVVAFGAQSEALCIRSLGWLPPKQFVDLYAAYRAHTNIHTGRPDAGLAAACDHFKIAGIDRPTKEAMRELAAGGGPSCEAEMDQLVNYCEQDVRATSQLLPHLLVRHSLQQLLLWGRYVGVAVASIEAAGIPLDMDLYHRLKRNWPKLKWKLREQIGDSLGLFADGTLRQEDLRRVEVRARIRWPRTATGKLSTDEETLKSLAVLYPPLELLSFEIIAKWILS